MSFEDAVAAIARADAFPDLLNGEFAVGGPGHAYRMLVKIVHPDVVPAARRATATQAAAKLSALWARAQNRTLTTRRATYRLGDRVASGDIAELWEAGDDALLKLPRQPGDNDLMRAEISALTTLWRDGDPRHRAYAPRLIESFTHEDDRGCRRTAAILERQAGFVPLTGLEHRLDPRDVAWMWRRLLTGLGWAHRAGVVHGAVLPEHVLIHPGEHGLVLVDWCYSVAPGGTVPAVVARHRAAYPPEVPGKRPATAATDIFMATGLMLRLIENPPARMRRFAAGCRYDAPRMRPQDAWQLLAEFDELLEDLYGPRRFRPFALPAR
ncbi:molecular chaperone DnaJ [Actinoplanes sp. NPDC049316]|uniref:molecular chaperone DnaJ n=1 Tax=Actinoplanes sp. NPDC049316 TaxID=3154727 RepID=UPI00343215C4